MKIAIAGLSCVKYGAVVYLKNLLYHLAEADKINKYHIFVHKYYPAAHMVRQDNFIYERCPSYTRFIPLRFLWEQMILPVRLGVNEIDVIYTAKNINILFASCKTIIYIGNMEPFAYKRYVNHWWLNVYSWTRALLTMISMRKADKIIAPSKTTEAYLKSFFPDVVREKTEVIYNGNPLGRASFGTNIPDKTSPFLLSASKFVAYANQLNLIEGYALLSRMVDNIPELWLVGGILDSVYYKKVQKAIVRSNLTKKVKILGMVAHEELVSLYSKAAGFVFSSTLEVCPHTLIEAMACGVPMVVSKIEPMPEICEDAAIYFDPFNKYDIAEKIRIILTDSETRERLKKSSLKRSVFFDWTEIAKRLVKVFEEV